MKHFEYVVEKDDKANGLSELLLFTKSKSKAYNMMNKQVEPSHYVIYKIEAGERIEALIFLSEVIETREVK